MTLRGPAVSHSESDVAHARSALEVGAVGGGPCPPRLVEMWPPGISSKPTMRISDVLTTLKSEFPAITHSKLRFLEDQGLVEPLRTASGYRQYSLADVERLRFVLAEQRDRYLPLKVIKDRLAELDLGVGEDLTPTPRRIPADGAASGPHSMTRLTVEVLAAEAGVEVGLIEDLVGAGIIRPNSRGHFDAWTQQIVTLVAGLAEHGIEARHLRSMRTAVDRDLSLVTQIVAPLRSGSTPSARARAGSVGAELGETLTGLHAALLRQGIADLPL